jgi:hypothetical protein
LSKWNDSLGQTDVFMAEDNKQPRDDQRYDAFARIMSIASEEIVCQLRGKRVNSAIVCMCEK